LIWFISPNVDGYLIGATMPLFGFICQDCQTQFDYLVRNPRQFPTEVPCSKCGSIHTQRVVDERSQASAEDLPATPQQSKQDDPFSLKTLGKDLEKKR